jgi:hypothetical protein
MRGRGCSASPQDNLRDLADKTYIENFSVLTERP